MFHDAFQGFDGNSKIPKEYNEVYLDFKATPFFKISQEIKILTSVYEI